MRTLSINNRKILVEPIPNKEYLREKLAKVIMDEKYIQYEIATLCHKPFLNFNGGWYDTQSNKIHGGVIYNVELPPGSWKILAKTSDITEEQAMEIVESKRFKKAWEHSISTGFINYATKEVYNKYMDTALDSFRSLCAKEKIKDNDLLLIEQI